MLRAENVQHDSDVALPEECVAWLTVEAGVRISLAVRTKIQTDVLDVSIASRRRDRNDQTVANSAWSVRDRYRRRRG